MIGRLKGTIWEKQEDGKIILDVNGVGYNVLLPLSSLMHLGDIGEETTLFIHTHVREDAMSLFGFITEALVLIGSYIWIIPLIFIIPGLVAVLGEDPDVAAFAGISTAFRLVFQFIMGLIGIIPGLFINAGVLHLGLLILGANKRSYIETFKVVCFSKGASVLTIVPVFGIILGMYNVVVEIIGLRERHETTTGKAILAWLIIPLICCVLVAVLVVPLAAGLIFLIAGNN